MMIDDEPPAAWERQRDESAASWHGFQHFRDLTGVRSISRAYRGHLTSCLHRSDIDPTSKSRVWGGWSVKFDWLARADAYSKHLDGLAREKFAQELLDIKAKEARLVSAGLSGLSIAYRVVLAACSHDQQIDKLILDARASPSRLAAWLDRAARNATAMAQLIQTERLIHGLTTETIAITDTSDMTIANAIVRDPVAVELAGRLLDQIARAAPVPAVARDVDDHRALH